MSHADEPTGDLSQKSFVPEAYFATFLLGLLQGQAERQAILQAEKDAADARQLCLSRAEARFGPASPADRLRLDGICDVDHLYALIALVVIAPIASDPVTTWNDFWSMVSLDLRRGQKEWLISPRVVTRHLSPSGRAC